MYVLSNNVNNIIFPLKFSNFYTLKNIGIFHGQVFVMLICDTRSAILDNTFQKRTKRISKIPKQLCQHFSFKNHNFHLLLNVMV